MRSPIASSISQASASRTPAPLKRSASPHLDEVRTGRTHRVVVEVALAAHHHRFVPHSRSVGEAVHTCGIQSREARGGAEKQPGRGARGHHARLGPGRLRDDFARPALELGHVDTVLRGSCIAAAISGGIGAPLTRVAVPFALMIVGTPSRS